MRRTRNPATKRNLRSREKRDNSLNRKQTMSLWIRSKMMCSGVLVTGRSP